MKAVNTIRFSVAVNMLPNLNLRAMKLLLQRTDNNIEAIFNREIEENQLSPPEKKILEKISQNKEELLSKADEELELVDRDDSITLVTLFDNNYPEELRNLYDPPLVLYIKGNILKSDSRSVAIVGTRTPSKEGISTAFSFAKELAKMKVTIISGLAMGVDTYAHRGALDANGRTIAVLGSGLYKVYPYENMDLYIEISKNGAVISEFPLKQTAEKYNFPRRNRIISGMSLGTVVVEAASRSGALITADFALQQGKEVFAVPGSIYSKVSIGANRLIKEGAKLVQSVSDIIDTFNNELLLQLPETQEEQDAYNLTELDKAILEVLSDEAVTVDYISEKTGFKTSELESELMILEINGYVSQMPGQRFIKLE